METNEIISNVTTTNASNAFSLNQEESTPLTEAMESNNYTHLSDYAIDSLLSIGKWMKTCGIISTCFLIISIGFYIYSRIKIVSYYSSDGYTPSYFNIIDFFLLLIYIISGIGTFFIYKAGTNITTAIEEEESLDTGFTWQKRYWMLIGIIGITMAIIYSVLLFLMILLS